MVGNMYTSKHVTFLPQDVPRDRANHNDPFHLVFFIHKAKVRSILIYGGVGLKICNLKVVKGLGYSIDDVDP